MHRATNEDLNQIARDALAGGAAGYEDAEAWALACGLNLDEAAAVGVLAVARHLSMTVGLNAAG